LRQHGLPPGPLYKDILVQLRAAWLDVQIHTPAEEAELLDTILSQYLPPARKTIPNR